jgi:single-stranded-DNA-specific exonuclease
MRYRWTSPETPDPVAVSRIENEVGTSRIVSSLLVLRGLAEPGAVRRYLEPDLATDLHDPFLMADMEAACRRLKTARDRGETVMVHGDYDVDGIASLAVLVRFLESLGIASVPYVPQRLTDGYGVSERAIAEASARGVGVLVTCDCGIRENARVREAREQGIDVIITDHHQPGETLPEAYAVLNPNREGCGYPDKSLAGVGVAWKLCQGLHRYLDGAGEDPINYLDLVCLGAVADVVPVLGENRAIIRYGLERISKGERPGIRALRDVAELKADRMTYRTIAFVLAPRVNAAGRLGAAERAFRLLYTDDEEEALSHARWLEEENRRRREIDSGVTEEVRGILARRFDSRRDYGLVLASGEWHPGVIGIVASRIAEEYHRPTVLISIDERGVGRGSARSIPGFPLYDALSRCSGRLLEFGGHSYAAGLKVAASEIDAFREEFRAVAEAALRDRDLRPELSIDLDIGVEDVSESLARELKGLEPYGPGNPAPLFRLRNVEIVDAPRVLRRNTLRLTVGAAGMRLGAVGFGMGDRIENIHRGSRIDAAVRVEENRWRGESRIELRLEDLVLGGAPAGCGSRAAG